MLRPARELRRERRDGEELPSLTLEAPECLPAEAGVPISAKGVGVGEGVDGLLAPGALVVVVNRVVSRYACVGPTPPSVPSPLLDVSCWWW